MKLLTTATALTLLSFAPFVHAGPVNVNTADAKTISEALTGIGLAKAEAIVDYRKKHGPFQSIDDLSLVKGIGERTVDKNRPDIQVTPAKQK